MAKEGVEQMKEEPIIQFGIGDEGKLYRVVRSFFLETKSGPLEAVKKGSLVLLAPHTGEEAFYAGKVIPVELGEFFEVTRFIRMEQRGEWVDLQPGDIVKLTREEAIPLLKAGQIKGKKGGIEK